MNTELARLLADGQFHSGVELGERLQLTRAAVWKQISQLDKLGLDVESVKGVGYRLRQPILLLEECSILAELSQEQRFLVSELQIVQMTDSTNSLVRGEMSGDQAYRMCLAEYQSAGRGRRGRAWVSPFGSNLYLSVATTFYSGFESLGGLSLAVGVAVAKALEAEHVRDLGLKWPNDVWVREQKIAGILIEIEGEQGGPLTLIIGVGVNVNMEPAEQWEIDQPWTSMLLEKKRESENFLGPCDRNRLAGRIAGQLVSTIEQFKREGFGQYRDNWLALDVLLGQQVVVKGISRELAGVYRGVDNQGHALLEQADGSRQVLGGGELSLRKAL